LIAETSDYLVDQGRRQGVPVGFTWASLIVEDREDLDQLAWERANGKAMAQLLEGSHEDAEYSTVAGLLVVRVLDEDGEVTPEGIAAAEAMCSLADYALLDSELEYEIQQEGWVADWEDVTSDIERGNLWVWEDDRRSITVIDELPEGWKEKLDAAYFEKAQNFSEDPTDDRGYHKVKRGVVADLVTEFGWLEEDDE
jgi:hypothetical protein